MSEIDEKQSPSTSTDVSELEQKAAGRVDPILERLSVSNVEIDKNKIRALFGKMWVFDKVDELSPDEQFLYTVGLFIYYAHNVLDDYNIRVDQAREAITGALRAWQSESLEKEIAGEKAAPNPFKAFVETGVPRVDEIYPWKHFLLDHKKSDEKEWTYKIKKCWFSEFFIRLGRTDYIGTACLFDMIPAEARKDYVNLKLQNLFAKLGTSCQFTYTPAKKGP
ncbi:MAG: L-2-amino-thiazoline-4-carboxylic acid hydrolase [Nitrospinae bacterium]|nr:L-2-amino-thiazoline-4-carboxylic acid hydrolase [Nitrospinota bacterium]